MKLIRLSARTINKSELDFTYWVELALAIFAEVVLLYEFDFVYHQALSESFQASDPAAATA